LETPWSKSIIGWQKDQEHVDWPIAEKKEKKKVLKLWRLPKIEDSIEKWSPLSFGPPI
jgi:hypothetical protein